VEVRLVRTTPYVKSGVTTGTQGARICDSTGTAASRVHRQDGRQQLLEFLCHQTAHRKRQRKPRRWAAYAEFRNREQAVLLRVYAPLLDVKRSAATCGSSTHSAGPDRDHHQPDRSADTAHEQVIFAGDMNSWRSNP
jgi:hypothetical protein